MGYPFRDPELRQYVLECIIFRYNQKESMDYIFKKGHNITDRTFRKKPLMYVLLNNMKFVIYTSFVIILLFFPYPYHLLIDQMKILQMMALLVNLFLHYPKNRSTNRKNH